MAAAYGTETEFSSGPYNGSDSAEVEIGGVGLDFSERMSPGVLARRMLFSR
jgi:hypothetical protein